MTAKNNLRLYDNTRISDYRRCPRYYFFRHVRHWSPPGASIPLIFGGAWHDAMDKVWPYAKAGTDYMEVVDRAYDAFVHKWVGEGMPHPSEIDMEMAKALSPRLPSIAKEMLYAYVHSRGKTIKEFDLLEVERPFAVPLDPDDDTLFYVGRIDKVVMDSKTIRGIEHKTTTSSKMNSTKEPRIRGMYLESYSPNSQVDGYAYALHLLYPNAQSVDVWVDAALVHKSGDDFQYVPVSRTMQQLDSWLWDTRRWIANIEADIQRYALAEPSDPYMAAFPKNTNACFDFNTACPFLELCKSRPNPKTWDQPPGEYIKKEWDPLSHIGGIPRELD